MSNRKKKKPNTGRKPAPASSKRRFPVIWVVLGLVGLAIAASIFLVRQASLALLME
ncbi:MAG: hypothetical protein GY850_06525 [bacterium]|nr:hypothetical protein [bacterium]